MRIDCFLTALCVTQTLAFTTTQVGWVVRTRTSPSSLFAETTKAVTVAPGFIETELRGAAMKLHTTRQAPKEGQVVEKATEKKYVPTHQDYLQFLVDSRHVYEALEEVVNTRDELKVFRNTGLERTQPLEQDIAFMAEEYDLKIPHVGKYGEAYAEKIKTTKSIPEFMCHFYNYYFAHTAGGRMIGKQMAALLLEKKTLEFYKWDGDLNEIKDRVKGNIEDMAAQWSREEKDQCIGGTAAAFQGGGGINAYLSGGKSGH